MQTALTAYQQFAGENFTPNPMQEELFSHIANEDMNPALLLKAPTGSGKTEAVLIPSLESCRRLFLIFPSRSLVDDQIRRCEEYLQQASEKTDKSYALVIDTGAESVRTVFQDGKVLEKGKRHLYDGDVILTTFDKFLYRFFGFGEPNKSYIFPFRIHHSQRQNLFCFDEAHAYDQVAFVNFQRLVKALYKADRDMVVMTATMPETYQKELSFLDTVDYITGDNKLNLENWQKQKQQRLHRNKTITHIAAKTQKEVTDKIQVCVSERYETDKRTIVTIETIKDLIPAYQDMKAQNEGENIFLYHGRLSNRQRKKVYSKLKQLEDENKGYLLFTTSAIEVGCDLNAHLLITELCNPDSLIQRAGRCNRNGKIEGAEIVIVGNKIPDFLSILSQEKIEKYLEKLHQQNGGNFNPSDILELMEYAPHSDYRAEVLFDMLYEYVYEARLENKPLHDRGLVITRSFEPSITLTTKVPEEEAKHQPENAVSVSIRSCIAWKDKDRDESVNTDFKVYHRFYDDRAQTFKFELLKWHGSIYFKDLFVEVPECYFCEELGYVEPPKVFEDRGTRGYRRNFVYYTDENNERKEIRLYYLKDFEKPQLEDEIQPRPLEPVDTEPQKPVKPFEMPPEVGKQLSLFEDEENIT